MELMYKRVQILIITEFLQKLLAIIIKAKMKLKLEKELTLIIIEI